MSKQLFGYSVTETKGDAPVPVQSSEDAIVDLGELLKTPVTGFTEPVKATPVREAKEPEEFEDEEPEEEDEYSEETEASTEGEAAPDAPKFDRADFEKFKEKTGKVIGDYVKDPKKVTKVLVKVGGGLRMLLYPFIYKLIIFDTSDERRDCERILKRMADAKRQGITEPITLDPYEQELMGKWNDFKAQKKKIMFTDEEVNLITEVFEDKIKELPIGAWLEKYDWLLVLLYVESKRFVPVAGIRMKNQLMKDFNSDED